MPQVYDKPDTEPSSSEESVGKNAVSDDELRSITGINPAEEKKIEDRASKPEDLDAQEEAAADDDNNEQDDNEPLDDSELAQRESTVHQNQVGRGYKKQENKKGLIARGLARNNRIFAMAGGGMVLFLIIGIVIFFTLLPLKILHIVNNLQNRFYATSENAVQHEGDVLFSSYVKKYVLPALKNCPADINKSCNPIAGKTMLSQLFQGWRNARLEDKLLTNYGVEFRYNKASKNFYIKTPQMSGDGVSLGTEDSSSGFIKSQDSLDEFLSKSNDPEFKKVGRNELRQAYKDAFANETKWKQVMYKFKAGGLLARKYGLKRCIIACGARDNFNDWKDNKTQAAKLVIVQRVVAPRAQMIGVVLSCIFSGTCDTTTTSNGKTVTAFETQVQQTLDAASSKYGVESVADMVKTANDIGKRGLQKYILDKAVAALIGAAAGDAKDTPAQAAAKIAQQEAAQEVSDKILGPVAWASFAAKVVNLGSKIGPELKQYSYVTNAATMVNTYMIYRTFADETKSGHVDPAIVGSFTNSLGPGDKTTDGGSAGAEQTPLYAQLIDGVDITGQSFPNYKCNNGKPAPTGTPVCPEDNLALGSGNSTANSISAVFNSNYMAPVKFLAGAIGTVTKVVNSVVGSIIANLPGIGTVTGWVVNAAKPAIEFVTQYAIPNIASSNPSGGMNFALAAGGADVSGNDFAQNGLGGKALSNTQVADIFNQQTQADIQSYQNKSLFARMFDRNSNYSLTTKLAMAMPTNWNAVGPSIASIFSNPLGKLKNSFASLFNLNSSVFAAATPQADPFGVTQYGYPANDPNLSAANADPEAYWTQNCSTDGNTLDWNKGANASWQTNTKTDPNTGLAKNDTTNPCLLIQAAAGSTGAVYDSNLLTPDDTASN